MTETKEGLKQKIIDAINREIGNDTEKLEHLKRIYDDTKNLKASLEEKVQAVSSEAPSKAAEILRDADEAICRVKDFATKILELKGSSSELLQKVTVFYAKLGDKLDEVMRLERQKRYVGYLQQIAEISTETEAALKLDQCTAAVNGAAKLSALRAQLDDTGCTNLLTYAEDMTNFWHTLIREKLTKEFEETLKHLQWPFISTNQEVLQAPPSADVMSKFSQQMLCLLKLEQTVKRERKESENVILSYFAAPTLAMEQLLEPLRKRFTFHFSGKRPTNNLEKPEWYMRQVLEWIGDHFSFLQTTVQPIYKTAGLDTDSAMEFTRALVQLAVEKLSRDLPKVSEDDAVFSHTIAQVLRFEKELRGRLDYPSSEPSALLVLTQAQFLSRWIALERNCAVEKLDILLDDEGAWSYIVDMESDSNESVRLTKCVEGFLQILLAITDRYKCLPQPGHKMQFLELQLELLDEFRVRLVQVARQEKLHGFASLDSSRLCAIVNSVAAVMTVLDDWADLPFFMQLHSYKLQMDAIERRAAEIEQQQQPESSLLTWFKVQDQLNTDNPDEGSVFGAIRELYDMMQKDLLKKLVQAVMLEVKARSQPYRLDKWASLPSGDCYIQPSLSPTGSAMLQAIALGLQWLRNNLSPPLFTLAWQQLASQINIFLFEELILQRQFNEAGAAQLSFDVEENLFLLFADCTPKPELHFKELKDSCTLLRLPKPTALLLLDTLAQAVQSEQGELPPFFRDGKAALKEQGILKLSVEDALSVLRKRIL